jgi:basic amino acid/polyamine antiporter, APA family
MARTTATLGMWDAVSVIVGIIIGASIFRAPAEILGNIDDSKYLLPAWLIALGLWALVGFLSFVGALCYAELATTYPTTGGDYGFISRAYGRWAGFMFAWSEMSIIRTGGSISAMAYVFSDYARRVIPFEAAGEWAGFAYAAVAVVLLTGANMLGLRVGKPLQHFLTSAKLIGLAAIIATGVLFFLWPRSASDVVTASNPVVGYSPALAVAAVFIFYAYGGWNEAGYVAAELRDRQRSIVRSLVIGVGIVSIVYLAVNAAYLLALGVEPIRRSKVVAADVMALPLGNAGATAISILIMISALGAINGLLFTGSRLYATFGSRERLFVWLRRREGSVPYGALAVQAFFSLALMSLFELGRYWKPPLAAACATVGIKLPGGFSRQAGGFEDVVAATAPVFWLFFLLTGCSLLVLRIRDRQAERPFRVPLCPLTPLLFCASSSFMLYESTHHALTVGPGELLTVAAFVLLGVPLYFFSKVNREPQTR